MAGRNPASVRLCTAVVKGKSDECRGPVPEGCEISLCNFHLLMAHQEVEERGGYPVVGQAVLAAQVDPAVVEEIKKAEREVRLSADDQAVADQLQAHLRDNPLESVPVRVAWCDALISTRVEKDGRGHQKVAAEIAMLEDRKQIYQVLMLMTHKVLYGPKAWI